jgi:hypothetical protein
MPPHFLTRIPAGKIGKYEGYLLLEMLERDFFTLSECISNVLITGKSNFDNKKVGRIGSLGYRIYQQKIT